MLPPAVDSSSDDDVPLAAMMLERDAERAAEKEDVKSVEDIKSVSAPVPADPVPPTLSGASDAPPLTLALRLKHKYNKAKEVLELGAHGGMKMVGRHAHGAASETHSGHRWSFLCCYHKTNKCPASGTIASDFSVHVEAGHLIPDKNTAGAFIAGTGCERYGKFRGLHQSEMEIVQQHDVTAPSATNAKAVSNKIAAKQLADRRAAAVTHQEGNEDTFVKHTPSARSIRHTVNKAKAHCDVDLSSIGDIQTLVEKYWSEKTKHDAHPVPCEVKVIHSESWETEIPPRARKAPKTAPQATPARADDVSPVRTRKTRTPTEPPKSHNSIVIFSTVLLMALCASSSAASIDGTYRCAPARSTIADFGVFVGRAFVPCFLGILTGPKSGDTTEHWRRFLVAVRNALGGWAPQTCVRDHAACLINALNDVWSLCVQIVCYFHVRQCIRRRRSKMPALSNKYKEIMHFIEVLHYTTPENWSMARCLIDAKLPKVFRDYFFDKTFHGDGLANEVWAHNLAEPGESMSNCAAERFHATLRSDPDMFNGVQKPAYMHAVGLLGNVVGAISFRCAARSSLGGLLYTEHADTTHGTRVRNAWKAALHLVESGVLDATHSCARGTAFWFLVGGKPVSRAEVARLTARKGNSAADYLAFFQLRRATTEVCQCIPHLKFGFCRHSYAVSIRLNGMKFVPHGVRDAVRAVHDESDVDVAEVGDVALNDASDSESAPDTDGSEEDIAPVSTTQRSRRAAVVYNASDF